MRPLPIIRVRQGEDRQHIFAEFPFRLIQPLHVFYQILHTVHPVVVGSKSLNFLETQALARYFR